MTTVAKGRAHWAICAVLAGALHAAALAGDVAVTPTSVDGVVVNISPAAVGQDVQATIAVNASAPPQVGQQTLVSEALTYEYTWSFSPDGSIDSVSPSQNPSSQTSSTATGSFPTPGEKTISVTVTIGGTADYSWVDADGNAQTVTLGVSGSAQFQIDVDVYQADAISITPLDKFSINKTGISVSAFVSCLGAPVSGVTVTFSGGLSFSSTTAATSVTQKLS